MGATGADVSISDRVDLTSDDADVFSSCNNDDDKAVVSGGDISAVSAAGVATSGNSSVVAGVADVNNFVDVDGNAVFDNAEFDQLFQDFLNDDTFADLV